MHPFIIKILWIVISLNTAVPVIVAVDRGSRPNTEGLVSNDLLLFEAIGTNKQQNDIAIQLIQAGELVNPENAEGYTLLMLLLIMPGQSRFGQMPGVSGSLKTTRNKQAQKFHYKHINLKINHA